MRNTAEHPDEIFDQIEIDIRKFYDERNMIMPAWSTSGPDQESRKRDPRQHGDGRRSQEAGRVSEQA